MSLIDLGAEMWLFNQPVHVVLTADLIRMDLKACQVVDDMCVEVPMLSVRDS